VWRGKRVSAARQRGRNTAAARVAVRSDRVSQQSFGHQKARSQVFERRSEPPCGGIPKGREKSPAR